METREELSPVIEAVLFAAGYPVPYERLAEITSSEIDLVKETVTYLKEKYENADFGIQIVAYAEECQFCTKEGYESYIREALGIKPIMKVGNHSISTIGKARGEKKLIKEIAKTVLDDMEPSTPYSIAYGSDLKARDEMEAEMIKRVGYPPVYHFQIGPAIAINAGHRAVGVVFEVSRKRAEKEAKNKEK